MKNILLLTTIIFYHFSYTTKAQDFDTEVGKAVATIAQQLNKKKNIQVAIYPFKFLKNNEEGLAEYITDEFWEGLPQKAISYEVMDRATFEEYFQEHQLKSEGLIDPTTEKQFGMLIAADAYVTGKVYVFNSIIRLKIKVTDTQTGKIIATGSQKLPITYDMAQYLNLEGWEEKKKEIEKNKSENPNCDKENVGDVCFQNNTKNFYYIEIIDQGTLPTIISTISVNIGEYGCFKNLPLKGFHYRVSKDKYGVSNNNKLGSFHIKECESKVITIN
ncbi:hypothetical protein GCM10011344_13310 [Dokdonia pacifica]|uniref:Curli production assembly/transport component CsgG n=1 Tax=Dokdonia pacifica TaxID=1627892 RepID=A0A238W9W7_9FLAO|nr:CsgG/HfaB family protein [Dokdonia pacifica]GGG14008.1 hypothetical protein GCM10011344_13310 [Dokdonia pacifica]SNR43013.1 hypothetical protein SAMN06265376_101819 [Dokdonia pacifica]